MSGIARRPDAFGADCERLVVELPEIDVLVHNAGAAGAEAVLRARRRRLAAQFALQCWACRLCRHYARAWTSRLGRTLFNASVTGGFQSGEMPHYGAAKAAVLGSRGLAESLPASGVTVNAFMPGPTRERRSRLAGRRRSSRR